MLDEYRVSGIEHPVLPTSVSSVEPFYGLLPRLATRDAEAGRFHEIRTRLRRTSNER